MQNEALGQCPPHVWMVTNDTVIKRDERSSNVSLLLTVIDVLDFNVCDEFTGETDVLLIVVEIIIPTCMI